MLFKTSRGLMLTGSLFLSVATIALIVAVVMGITKFNQDGISDNQNVITVSASAEAFAVPDVANFSFTVRDEQETVAAAQDNVSETVSGILRELERIGIEETDIKTQNYSSYPRYEWRRDNELCDVRGDCDNKRILTGYELNQSVQVKLRDLDNVTDVLTVLGQANVDNLNGPSFEVDDQDSVKDKARSEAIAKAKVKAKVLADELGVDLGKLVDFYETDSGYYPQPFFAEARAVTTFADEAGFAPEIPVGENQVNASVTLTYKIK